MNRLGPHPWEITIHRAGPEDCKMCSRLNSRMAILESWHTGRGGYGLWATLKDECDDFPAGGCQAQPGRGDHFRASHLRLPARDLRIPHNESAFQNSNCEALGTNRLQTGSGSFPKFAAQTAHVTIDGARIPESRG